MQLVELGCFLADIIFDRWRRCHVTEGDLQGNFHISFSSGCCSYAQSIVNPESKNGKRHATRYFLAPINELIYLENFSTPSTALARPSQCCEFVAACLSVVINLDAP
jgi:hypothetical protein